MKTILVPTDFSSCADNAVNYAIKFAEKFNSKIIIHNSYHLPTFALQIPFEDITEEQLYTDAKENIKDYLEHESLKSKKIEIEEDISLGLAVDNIISLANEKKVDLIVMGTKGASNIEELMLGSNAATILEKAPCPVIVIPSDAKYKELKKIVFATDYRDNDLHSISFLSGIATKFNAEIIIIHISAIAQTDILERDLFEKFKEQVLKNIQYKNLSFKFLVGLNISKELNLVLEEENADLLVMSTRKRNIFIKMFERSLTKKMAYHTQIPILAFHSE